MTAPEPKRRIIRKLVLSDISAVDYPCQEHARMAIMKRAPEVVSKPDPRIADLKKRVRALTVDLRKNASNIEGVTHLAGLMRPRKKRRLNRRVKTLREDVSKLIEKFNPYHDEQGRFTTGSDNADGPSTGTIIAVASAAAAAGAAVTWIAKPIIARYIQSSFIGFAAGSIVSSLADSFVSNQLNAVLVAKPAEAKAAAETAAVSLTSQAAAAHDRDLGKARKKVLQATEELIAMRQHDINRGEARTIRLSLAPEIKHARLSKAAEGEDFIIQRLKLLVTALKRAA